MAEDAKIPKLLLYITTCYNTYYEVHYLWPRWHSGKASAQDPRVVGSILEELVKFDESILGQGLNTNCASQEYKWVPSPWL